VTYSETLILLVFLSSAFSATFSGRNLSSSSQQMKRSTAQSPCFPTVSWRNRQIREPRPGKDEESAHWVESDNGCGGRVAGEPMDIECVLSMFKVVKSARGSITLEVKVNGKKS